MNTIQELNQIASQLPPVYQQDLLAYAHDMLHEVTQPEDIDVLKEREEQLQKHILDRYVSYKQSGQKGRPLADVLNDLRVKYDLR